MANRSKHSIVLSLITCLYFIFSVSCVSAGAKQERSVYQSVDAEVIIEQSTQIIRDFPRDTSPQFLIEGQQLYLLIQTTYTKYNIVVAVRMTRWDSNKLGELLREHVDLRGKLPNPDAADGGIKWLKK